MSIHQHPETAAANNTGFYTRQGFLIWNPNPKGSFQCAIPMRHIRFCGCLFKCDLWDARYIAIDS